MIYPDNVVSSELWPMEVYEQPPRQLTSEVPIAESVNTRIYIGGLRHEVIEQDFRYTFTKFGNIKSLDIKVNYAFIEYWEEYEAIEAIRVMDRKTLDDNKLIVRRARSTHNEPRSRTEPYPGSKCFRCGLIGHR